ncbi:unnamed protein product [Urochloa humidicola]
MERTMQQPHSSNNRKLKTKHMPLLGVALVLLLFLPSPISSCKEEEKTFLLGFLDGISQASGLRTSWQKDTNCCFWEGIRCNIDGTVMDISLVSMGLEGHISPSIGNLTGLLRLNLSGNSLSGALPPEILRSSSIVSLDVSFNKLNGEFHELPSTPDRKMKGSIPPELGNCSVLRVLKAGHNQLIGTLPAELFNDTSLEHLSFPNNHLQGTLDPEHVVKLSKLVILDLGGNGLNGKFPDSIGQLKWLEELHLDYNNMSGELPSALSNCSNLTTFILKGNNF